MAIERYVRLFREGCAQAVRIPREFELPGNEALLRKEGDRLVLRAVPPRRLLEILAELSPLDEVFPPIADPMPRRLEI
jgi:antitoxin VapB